MGQYVNMGEQFCGTRSLIRMHSVAPVWTPILVLELSDTGDICSDEQVPKSGARTDVVNMQLGATATCQMTPNDLSGGLKNYPLSVCKKSPCEGCLCQGPCSSLAACAAHQSKESQQFCQITNDKLLALPLFNERQAKKGVQFIILSTMTGQWKTTICQTTNHNHKMTK